MPHCPSGAEGLQVPVVLYSSSREAGATATAGGRLARENEDKQAAGTASLSGVVHRAAPESVAQMKCGSSCFKFDHKNPSEESQPLGVR